MVEEDPNLSICMERLKIIPAQPTPTKPFRDDELPDKQNPFARKHKLKSSKSQSNSLLFGPSCLCKLRRVSRNSASFKRSTRNKLLREPIIVFVDKCTHIPAKHCKTKEDNTRENTKLFGETNSRQHDFKSIIAGCEQLSLSNDNELQNFSSQNFRESRNQSSRVEVPVSSSSCSQQAMARLCINPPCDVTIDELASYFETFVHIPKKMSSMAEMMYI